MPKYRSTTDHDGHWNFADMGPHGSFRDAEPSGPARAARPSAAPSLTAQARLSGALRDRSEAYRQDATVDLTIVEALLKLDEPEAAARTLDDHRASLQALHRDLQVAVADAAVEREAERLWETCAAGHEIASQPEGGLRRRVLALTGAAAVALVLLFPAGRPSPRTLLTSAGDRSSTNDFGTARERLEAAVASARALRAENEAAAAAHRQAAPRSAARSNVVRDKVRAILAADSGGSAAASSSAATVTDLGERRAQRAAKPTAAEPGPPPPPKDPGDPDPTDEVLERVPPVGGPFNAELPVDEPDLSSLSGELER